MSSQVHIFKIQLLSNLAYDQPTVKENERFASNTTNVVFLNSEKSCQGRFQFLLFALLALKDKQCSRLASQHGLKFEPNRACYFSVPKYVLVRLPLLFIQIRVSLLL